MFISIEGGEGVGKTTLATRIAERLEAAGRRVLVVREPGGTGFGEGVRRLFLDPQVAPVPIAEALLLNASRADLVNRVIRPALQGGGIVICDRYVDTTYAYQGFGRGLERRHLRVLHSIATGGLDPDLTFLLDMQPELAQQRRAASAEENAVPTDRIERESLAFHQKVRSGYLELASSNPRFRTIDASLPADRVFVLALRHLSTTAPFYLGDRKGP